MYYGVSLRDQLQIVELNFEFFESLSDFQINFIDMCFKQSIDEKMGLLGRVELKNYQVFEEFKIYRFQQELVDLGHDFDHKKAA